MAKIYKVTSSEGSELCHPENEDDFERLSTLINGSARRDTWSPIRVRLIHQDEGRLLTESDAPWLGSHALIFRQSVPGGLRFVLEQNGELLPLTCGQTNLSVYNVTNVLDALDEGASSLKRFKDGGIMMISRYVFNTNVRNDSTIFKLSCLRVSPTFVGEDFVDQWMGAGLRGLEFKQVWSS